MADPISPSGIRSGSRSRFAPKPVAAVTGTGFDAFTSAAAASTSAAAGAESATRPVMIVSLYRAVAADDARRRVDDQGRDVQRQVPLGGVLPRPAPRRRRPRPSSPLHCHAMSIKGLRSLRTRMPAISASPAGPTACGPGRSVLALIVECLLLIGASASADSDVATSVSITVLAVANDGVESSSTSRGSARRPGRGGRRWR